MKKEATAKETEYEIGKYIFSLLEKNGILTHEQYSTGRKPQHFRKHHLGTTQELLRWQPYKRFLGYEKGEDGRPAVVESEARVVKLIYRLFLKGKTQTGIRKYLEELGIPSPGGKAKWSKTTVTSILQNEKYKGDALLQKKFTVDFLEKKMKPNEGEVPQYHLAVQWQIRK